MKFIKKEHHQVISSFSYDIPDDEVIDMFGSIERFKEIISHLNNDDWSTPIGEPPSEKEQDNFLDFIAEFDYDDRNDDWWTDREGGYDLSYEIDENDSYDSDEVLLN